MANEDVLLRIKKIAERLKKEYHAEKVILFGSYAKGKATADSDVDLFVISSTKERFLERMAAVRKITRDLCYKLPLEPIILTKEEVSQRLQRGDQFVKQIIKEGVNL